jgi:hypothetical protein
LTLLSEEATTFEVITPQLVLLARHCEVCSGSIQEIEVMEKKEDEEIQAR